MAVYSQKFSNLGQVQSRSAENWRRSVTDMTSQLSVRVVGQNHLVDQYNRKLQHFCTTSYLGLDYEPSILAGAAGMIEQAGTLRIACSRNRCRLAVLDAYEEDLSEHFNAAATVTLSCSSATAAILPLIASGILNKDVKPVMVFDRFAHYSMNHLKALCAHETQVLTIGHNDLDELETLSKRHRNLVYVADSFYSMGGISPLADVVALQERYGIGLYFDDSHAMSIVGRNGRGHARSFFGDLPPHTFIVSSLAKAFGASGGVILYGDRQFSLPIEQYGGPVNWSQSLNAAGIGAGMAALAIHRSGRIEQLQENLQTNLRLFDSLVSTRHRGSPSAVRMVDCHDVEQANRIGTALAENGFLTSPVFFPVVPKDEPAIRLTLRADMTEAEIKAFCACLSHLLTFPVLA